MPEARTETAIGRRATAQTFGPEVNLFVDHSQIVQLEALRQGIWGTKDTWGRILNLPGAEYGPVLHDPGD
jgi:hypothetical protein